MKMTVFIVLVSIILAHGSGMTLECYNQRKRTRLINTMRQNARRMDRYVGVSVYFKREMKRLPEVEKRGRQLCYDTEDLVDKLTFCAEKVEKRILARSTRLTIRSEMSIMLHDTIRASRVFCGKSHECCILKDSSSSAFVAKCRARYCTGISC